MVTFKERLILLGFILYVQVNGFTMQSEEPSCYSRFDYEYKLLTKVVALETTASKLENLISHLEQKIDDTNKKLADQNKPLEDMPGTPGGSIYTRWGRTTCNANRTQTVYSGYAAGSHYTKHGAAVNYLCLTKEPLWSKFEDTKQSGAPVYGAEYKFNHRNSVTFFGRKNTNEDAPCAVCQSPRSQLLMIPGRNKCLDG
ncbi:uncharacterized protein LOC127866966 [Dreissena polymorpha]|uniref:uncharacterized protein LOC127866966 n=1 Tax=Dreissena polymorpha TaxID=45954 RepID=UPI002264706C|nr:uncharacterized protein LOC127866966 [Dreissena polymorpha]